MAPKSVAEIEIDGHALPITNPDKMLFPHPRRDEARPRPLLPRGRGAADAGDAAAGRC